MLYITMYSEAQKKAIYKWREVNRSKHNEVRMNSYYRLKAFRDTFRELVGLVKVFL